VALKWLQTHNSRLAQIFVTRITKIKSADFFLGVGMGWGEIDPDLLSVKVTVLQIVSDITCPKYNN
jgi:hypothetical protein